MICQACKKNKAVLHPYFGFLPCEECQKRQSGLVKPGEQIELTTEDIKSGRKAYWHDYHPSHRKGQLSKEFVDKWGKKAARNQGFSEKEIAEAKNVWNDDKYYNS